MNIDILKYGKIMKAYGKMQYTLKRLSQCLLDQSPNYVLDVIRQAIAEVERLEGEDEC